MDKLINKPIVDFLNDFNLKHEDGSICFEAVAVYNLTGEILHFPAQITIVTINAKELDVIYVLNDEIRKQGLPEMFPIKNINVQYEKGKFLMIFDIVKEERMYVALYPKSNDCDSEEITKSFLNYLTKEK